MKRGFTLIEVLVALSIFSIMAVMGTSILYTMFNTRDTTAEHANRMSQLQMAMVLIEQDLTQIVMQPLDLQSDHLEFSRGGIVHPDNKKMGSTLNRVRYSVDNYELIRQSDELNQIIHPSAKTTQSRILLRDVQAFKVAYIDRRLQTHDLWRANRVPFGIRVSLTLKEVGEISKLYLLPQSTHIFKRFQSEHREDNPDAS